MDILGVRKYLYAEDLSVCVESEREHTIVVRLSTSRLAIGGHLLHRVQLASNRIVSPRGITASFALMISKGG